MMRGRHSLPLLLLLLIAQCCLAGRVDVGPGPDGGQKAGGESVTYGCVSWSESSNALQFHAGQEGQGAPRGAPERRAGSTLPWEARKPIPRRRRRSRPPALEP